ncbi:VOC family protein [Actinokineospora guangxiensis]|uniref:VOC family protein n=1 Tax=Actinokineospora guangxiensis TaxID=1490288 RepID=A0ABW0ESM1_9PSEU
MPCLVVHDLDEAVDYYRDVVGLEPQVTLDTPGGRVALVRGYGVTLLLQERTGQPNRADRAPPEVPLQGPWAAAFLVGDIDALHARLADDGRRPPGDLVPAFGARFFEFVDCAGNLVCVGESAAVGLAEPGCDGRTGLRGAIGGVLADGLVRARAAAHETAAALRARPRERAFRAFYDRLTTKSEVFYMFFTGGLLHWAAAAESHVPPEINLVLIGSALDDAERAWIAENLDRPFHHIDERTDDIAAWQLLFEVNEHSFGWIDIDCFVLNPEVFAELADVSPTASMNCGWSMTTDFGFPTAGTHLLFVNRAAIQAVREAGVPADPGTHDWDGHARPLPQLGRNRVPTRRARALLSRVVPDHGGRPAFVSGNFYDTLILFQLLARSLGYPIASLRPLARRCTLPYDAESTDHAHWPEDVSDELFHLCGISYYSRFSENPGILSLYLSAEMVILDNFLANSPTATPAQYPAKRNTIGDDLAALGMTTDQARPRFRRHLIDSRGLSETGAERVLDSGRRPPRPLDHAGSTPATDRTS